jgi:hypothetical protein
MPAVPVDRLSQDAIPDAWKDGTTTVLALSLALAAQNNNRPIPWSVMRQAIESAITSRWLELGPDSGAWPGDVAGAAAVSLKAPAARGAGEPPPQGGYVPRPAGIYHASAGLEPSAFQDFAEVLPDLLKITAGVPLKFSLSVTLGDGQEIAPATVDSVNQLLEQVNAELRLT